MDIRAWGRRAAGLGFCVVLAACNGGAPPPWSHDGSVAMGSVASREAAYVLLRDTCPSEQKEELVEQSVPLLIVGALVPVFADMAVKAVKGYVEQAKLDLTANYAATGAEALSSLESSGTKCLVVVRGRLAAVTSDLAKGLKDSSGSLNSAKLKSIGLYDYPAFYLEAKLTGQGGGVVEMQPTYVYFASTAAKRSSSNKKAVAMSFMTSTDPKADTTQKDKAKDSALTAAVFTLGELEMGKEYKGDQIFKDQARLLSLGDKDGKIQKNKIALMAFVTETEEVSKVHQLLIDSLIKHEDALSKALQEALKEMLPKQPS